jgi:hypothetical protein
VTENVVPLGASAAQLGGAGRLVIERTTGGGFDVSSPDAPAWRAHAPNRLALLAALDLGFRETDVATYAERKGTAYDLDLHDRASAEAAMTGQLLPFDQEERERFLGTLAASVGLPDTVGPRSPSDVHDPLAWRPLADGRWASPSGRCYGPQTQVVARVVAKRRAMGVDTPA